jgi:hypothetical protein
MTHKVIILEFVVPPVLAIALGILLAVGAVYLGHYFGPVDQPKAHYFVASSP